MQITMQPAEHLTPAEIEQFLDAGTTLSFAGAGRKEIYGLVERTLRARQYPGLSKKDKGIVRRYLAKISGLSLSQITRLIARWRERGVIEPRASRRRRFPRRYTPDDIARLAAVDAAHEGLSGPAVRRILFRGKARTGFGFRGASVVGRGTSTTGCLSMTVIWGSGSDPAGSTPIASASTTESTTLSLNPAFFAFFLLATRSVGPAESSETTRLCWSECSNNATENTVWILSMAGTR